MRHISISTSYAWEFSPTKSTATTLCLMNVSHLLHSLAYFKLKKLCVCGWLRECAVICNSEATHSCHLSPFKFLNLPNIGEHIFRTSICGHWVLFNSQTSLYYYYSEFGWFFSSLSLSLFAIWFLLLAMIPCIKTKLAI